MSSRHLARRFALALASVLFASTVARAQRALHAFDELPDAGSDLASSASASAVGARWSFLPVALEPIEHRAVGLDLRPSGAPNRSFDLRPAGASEALASEHWEPCAPEELTRRRGDGKLCFGWYRLEILLPEKLDGVPVRDGALFFEVVVDDLAEVWVDGRLAPVLGTRGAAYAAGWNAPNRVLLCAAAEPGQRITIAIFAANAPLSQPPGNYLWIRSAALELYRAERAAIGRGLALSAAALRALRGDGARLLRVAEGFGRITGLGAAPELGVLVADAERNAILRLAADGTLQPYRVKSGAASTAELLRELPGARALALSAAGWCDYAEGGRARFARIERNGVVRTLLGSRDAGVPLDPRAVVARADGIGFGTDARGGSLWQLGGPSAQRLATPLAHPGALALDAEERVLYVADERAPRLWIASLDAAGEIRPGARELALGSAASALAVDAFGRIFTAQRERLRVLDTRGRLLGELSFEEPLCALAWEDRARRTLACATAHVLYRLELGPPIGIEALDVRWGELCAPEAELELLVDERTWLEGPAWDERSETLFFSDIPRNVVCAWSAEHGVREHLPASGWSGPGAFLGREPGSNGLLLDAHGRLVLCEHGNRRLTRLEPDGTRTVLAARFEGRRLNSPNDVCASADGALYFTDPPFGLPRAFEDPARELGFSGVYLRRNDGSLELLLDHLRAPNGIALARDERTLYVSDAVPEHPRWLAYERRTDGTLGAERVFVDGRRFAGRAPGGADGIEVHPSGVVLTAGPGGVYAFAPDGAHLATLHLGSATSNVELDSQGRTLYVTAGRRVWRLQLRGAGA